MIVHKLAMALTGAFYVILVLVDFAGA